MKKLFYIGLIGLSVFEILKVYFIMPMPGSQQMNSIDVAYFLYTYRWFFRIFFGMLILFGSMKAFDVEKKWIPILSILPLLIIIYAFNFIMTADHMFLQPGKLVFKSRGENILGDSSLVVAVQHGGEAKAYPVRFMVYHHQVRDTVGGKTVMVTYCSVCRTGRVYEPNVNGKPESFRLVGMDHFNAMFEDEATKSWWQQSTGKAITGKLKGYTLPEVESSQLALGQFFSLYPFGKVMQASSESKSNYDSLGKFESGKSKSDLTGTDSLSWKDKSWVVGIQVGDRTKAYDWNDLKRMKIIHDVVGDTPIVIVLSKDDQSFAAFQRNTIDDRFILRNDSLINGNNHYDLAGRSIRNSSLKSIKAYQEFWHSWKTFHPETKIYKAM